jgi:plasmid stability protein
MASLTVKGIPDDLLGAMRHTARRHRRSLNSEAIVAFERNVRTVARDPDEVLARLEALHREIGTIPHLTPEEMEAAIDEGRP